ncbi:MAG: PAS domain S-box protein [Chloroflexi bacterium]|nr:PAS domain S-box protein [Chloroflexota bacterium]
MLVRERGYHAEGRRTMAARVRRGFRPTERYARLALITIGTVLLVLATAYYRLLGIRPPLDSLPALVVATVLCVTLTVLYWLGWDRARYGHLMLVAPMVGGTLTISSSGAPWYLPQAILIPSALAMVLAGPAWVVGTYVVTAAILLVRAGPLVAQLGLGQVLASVMCVSCLVVSRLMIDAARHEAEQRADQAEQARAESERQADVLRHQQASLNFQATLLSAVEQPVVASDSTGRITYWNHAAEALLGWQADEVVGKRIADLNPPPHELPKDPDWWSRHREPGPSVRELTGARRDGSTFPSSLTSWPIFGPDGEAIGRVTVLADLTERLEAERQRDLYQQGEKLRALGQMAGGVAHDLNQALGVASGYVQLAQDELRSLPPSPERARLLEHLTTAAQATVQGADTVKRLLAFARQQEIGEPEIVDVSTVVEEAARFTAPQWRDRAQADGRPIELTLDISGKLHVRGWADSLREALVNLIFNAVDAMPEGGAIHMTSSREGTMVVVAVSDTGTGMPPDVQARIFEPFYTTKGEAGTGLGLAMVFGIVERLGGKIGVRSAEGQGTTFTLRLPVATELAAAPAPAEHPAEAPPARILVVDDEPPLAMLLAVALRRAKHQVDTAPSGERALDLLAAAPYDMVISDLSLGAGINGW